MKLRMIFMDNCICEINVEIDFIMKKIKVLFITHAPWRNDISIGNSYSNIFAGMGDRLEFAQIFIRDGMPDNQLVDKYFCISEKALIKSILTREPVGKELKMNKLISLKPENFSKVYNVMRSLRWNILLLARDMAGLLGKWKSKELDSFLDRYKPDIIFGTLIFIPIVNQIMLYAKEKTNAKLVTYPWDDWYHVNKSSISPFYYIRIFLERHYIKKCVAECSYLYTITEQMQKEYSHIFNKKCKVLRKGYSFDKEPFYEKKRKSGIKLVYAGNIGDNRWKVLSAIAKAIERSNKLLAKKLVQYIYTLTPVTDEINRNLNIKGASKIMGSLPSNEVAAVLADADVLIHVEPVDSVKLGNCRLSFSTKIVDYFHCAKCILAVGGENASMKYLKNNDAAIVVNDLNDLDQAVERLADDENVICEYGHRAWECGKKNHSISVIQDMVYRDFCSLVSS